MVFAEIKSTITSFSILKSQHQALVSFDFDRLNQRQALMRICFSALSAWPVLLALLFFMINPLRYHFSLTQMLGMENVIVQALLGTDWLYAGIVASLFFTLSYFTRKEFLIVILIGYLVSQGDLHLFLAFVLLSCTLLARVLTNLRWLRFLESYTRTVWMIASLLSFAAWAVATHFSFEFYKSLLQLGYFSQSMYANRLEVFILVCGLYYGLELFVLSCWGHFFMQRQREPSDFSVKYSTARVLKKLSLGSAFKTMVKTQIETINMAKPSYAQSDLDLLPKRLVDLHRKEETFLTTALTDLT